MKTTKLRIIIPLALLVAAGIAYVAHAGLGTLSAIGWGDVSVLCPVGALGTMIASKTIVPRAVVSLLLTVVAIIIIGRAGCGWMCPIPVWGRLRDAFRRQDSSKKKDAKRDDAKDEQDAEQKTADTSALTPAEQKMLKKGCKGSCTPHLDDVGPSNSRYIVLVGALASAAIFGFPVFCLICPIGLSFALVFALIMLFGTGDVTWSVVVIPVLLLLEATIFRKWCSHICPVSAILSLISKLNRTLRPTIDDSKCLETSRGAKCGRCSAVCHQHIDPRHPELGISMTECSRCMACIEACPGKAIKISVLPKKSGKGDKGGEPQPVMIETAEGGAQN